MMTQKSIYEFVYMRLNDPDNYSELSMFHPDKDIMFEIDDENFRLFIDVGSEKGDIDYNWQIGVDRYRKVTDEPPEEEVKFKEEFIKQMTEVEDHFKEIGELDFFNDGLNEFILMGV